MIAPVINKLISVGFFKFAPILVAGAGGEGHGEHASGPPHLPNLFTLLYNWGLLPEGVYHFASEWINVIYGAFTAIIMSIIAMRIYAKRQMIPEKAQNLVEMLVEGMYNFIRTILGDDAKKYTPFLGTLFFYILFNNFWGLIPGGHSPSTSINITASLAIIVFLYAQYTGVRRLGILGYLDHLAGQPRTVISWCLVPLLFPIHIIGELAKPFSRATFRQHNGRGRSGGGVCRTGYCGSVVCSLAGGVAFEHSVHIAGVDVVDDTGAGIHDSFDNLYSAHAAA